MTDQDLQEIIDEGDKDGDREIGEDEFMRMLKLTNIFWNYNMENKSYVKEQFK